MTNVVSFMSRQKLTRQQRIEAIVKLFDPNTFKYPAGLQVEEDTGELVAPPEAWDALERAYGTFFLTAPAGLRADNALGAVAYLSKLASEVSLRAKDPATYKRTSGTMTDDERAFVESLFEGDLSLPPKLIQKLNVFDKLLEV